MPYYSIAAQLLVHAILYRYSAWQIGELPQVTNAGPPPPCPHSWQAHGQAWWWQPGQHCRAPFAAKHFLLVQRGMGKVNCYRRSSAEHEPYDTTEVCHLRPGNSQRAAYVYIAFFFRKNGRQGGRNFWWKSWEDSTSFKVCILNPIITRGGHICPPHQIMSNLTM